MRLHLWDGHGSRTYCGRSWTPRLEVTRARAVKTGELVEHTADDLPEVVCRHCARSLTRRIGRWWWRQVAGGKWLAMRVAAKA